MFADLFCFVCVVCVVCLSLCFVYFFVFQSDEQSLGLYGLKTNQDQNGQSAI